MDISPQALGLIAFAVMFLLIAVRVPVAIAMGMVGAVGGWILNGPESVGFILGSVPFESVFPYSLSVIPLFIMMGVFAARAGLSQALYQAVNVFIGHRKGGLAMATIGACAAFGGTLGVLIPPSVIMVIYALLTEQSIGRMFAAALIPGILATALYIGAIWVRTQRNPLLGPADARTDWSGRLKALKNVWPVALLFGVVIGGIYLGWFSPTEAAAIGAAGAFMLALFKRQLNTKVFLSCLGETSTTSGMIFLILIGTSVFNYFVETTGLPQDLVRQVGELGWNRYLVLMMLIVFFIVLGCFMDALSMILLTLPFVYPLVLSLGFDPIWFGVIMVSVVEVGLITPPVGMNLFVILATTPELTLSTISRGIVAFLLADVVRLALLVAIPALSLWLPSLLMD